MCLAFLVAAARGQEPAPAASDRLADLPQTARELLADVKDFQLDFDHPAFYAIVEFVRRTPQPPGLGQHQSGVADWRRLLENPDAYRGRPVTVEGRIGRNKGPYQIVGHPELGRLTQLELHAPRQPIACTVILTEPAADLPLGAWVRVPGYFVLLRQYYDPAGQARTAALIVGQGPTLVVTESPLARSAGQQWKWLLGAVVVGVAAAILLLRRSGQRPRSDPRKLQARRVAPVDSSVDLAEWAEVDLPASESGSGGAKGDGDAADPCASRRDHGDPT